MEQTATTFTGLFSMQKMRHEDEAIKRRANQCKRREKSEVAEKSACGENKSEEGADGRKASHRKWISKIFDGLPNVADMVEMGKHMNGIAQRDTKHGGSCTDSDRRDRAFDEIDQRQGKGCAVDDRNQDQRNCLMTLE